MSRALASVDGRIVPLEHATVPVTDPGFLQGWSVFETARTDGGDVPLLDAHLDRLANSAVAAFIPSPPRETLARWARSLAVAHGGKGRLRLTLTGGGRCIILMEDRDPTRRGRPVRAARGPHRDEPFLRGEVKHGSRAPWMVAVRRAKVDEVLLVDDDGRFTEGTSSAVLAVRDGVIWTAPFDGRILPSTTVVELLARAEALGIPVRREGPPSAGPWQGLYVASATRWLSPVTELDGVALPGWEPVGRQLAADQEG